MLWPHTFRKSGERNLGKSTAHIRTYDASRYPISSDVAQPCIGAQVESQEEGIGSCFATYRGKEYGAMSSSMSAPPRSYPVEDGGLIEQGAKSVRKFYRVDTGALHNAA